MSAPSRTYRVLVAGSAEEDDVCAAGELALMEQLDAAGLDHRRLRSTATGADGIRIRRRTPPSAPVPGR